MRRQGSIFLGIILLGVGAVYLLQALDFWPERASAWPGFLIAIGLAIIIDRLYQGKRDSLLFPVVLVAIGVFLLLRDADILDSDFIWPGILIGAGVILIAGAFRRGTVETSEINIPLDRVARARVRIDHGGGELRLGSLNAQSSALCTGIVGEVEQKVSRSGDRVDVSLRRRGRSWMRSLGREFRLDFNPGVDLELDLHTGASDSRLDLTRLLVSSLELKTGASSTVVYLPERGYTRVSVDAGAASVDFRVPVDVAGRITADTGLADVDIDKNRFLPSSGGYESPDYSTAVNRVEIQVRGGLAGFKVR
jgi:hypothetical protein